MKSEGFRADAPSAISDYPDLIGDTAVILAKERIVPDVIENITDKAAFKVSFTDRMVEPGMMLSINDIANEPRVEITDSKKESVYSFIMVDPDMPSPSKPEYKDVVVWMVCNIKSKEFESGDFVVEYIGPEPGQGTHRYALLMFEQPGVQQIEAPSKRAYFQTKQWVKEHNWEPVAGVYLRSSMEMHESTGWQKKGVVRGWARVIFTACAVLLHASAFARSTEPHKALPQLSQRPFEGMVQWFCC